MLTVLRPALMPNWTAPAAVANNVSSPPRPTFTPGWNLVPRWRTRISPAFTTWPPNRLTPSRWALESRPLREDDAPFLCAIGALLSGLDAGHAERGELLTVPLALVVTGLVLELVNDDLGALAVVDHLSGDAGRAHRRGVRRHRPTVVDEEDRGQHHGLTGRCGDAVDLQRVDDRDLVLVAAGANDRVHGTAPRNSAWVTLNWQGSARRGYRIGAGTGQTRAPLRAIR